MPYNIGRYIIYLFLPTLLRSLDLARRVDAFVGVVRAGMAR